MLNIIVKITSLSISSVAFGDSTSLTCLFSRILTSCKKCKVYKIIDLPTLGSNEYNGMVLGNVVGIHINDEVIDDGKVNLEKIKPLSRLGYLDYSVVDNIFEMHRPEGSPRPDQVEK